MKITLKTLEGWGACSEAVGWFEKTAPAEGWTKAQAIKAVNRADWLVWALGKYGASRKQLILLACCAARRALRFVPAGEDRPRLTIEAAEANVVSDTPQTRDAAGAARAAARAAGDAARAAAWAAGDAARDAAWAAGDAAGDAAGAAGDAAWAAESLAIADDMRKLMRTKEYRMAGRKAGGSK